VSVHATDEEWTWIEKRVRQVAAGSQDLYSSWKRERLVGFLAQRLELKDREAEIDDLIFELGSPEQRAFRLVQLGRFVEAVDLAQGNFASSPGLIRQFADALVEAGAGPIAEALITSMLRAQENTFYTASYLSWLAEHAEKRGDLAAALDWWQQLFRASPDIEHYQKLRDVASQVGRWEDLRSELLRELEANQRWNVLVQIALDEDDVARALELLPRQKRRYGPRYDLQVAKAAEKDYPQAALDIYSGSIQGLIDARGRGNYQEAAGLLTRVRHLYARQNDLPSWDLYIADLRQRHRRLPALRDELNKAGL
jgi:tetratricopeptide (TPR) repeat protein